MLTFLFFLNTFLPEQSCNSTVPKVVISSEIFCHILKGMNVCIHDILWSNRFMYISVTFALLLADHYVLLIAYEWHFVDGVFVKYYRVLYVSR